LLSGGTLNLQSYMGMIMAIGVSVSNAFLMADHAEKSRFNFKLNVKASAYLAASSRMRPIIMTTLAMVAGMIPMALGMGDGGEQVAPLGQAVIGGLIMSSITTLLVLPHLFMVTRKKASLQGVSLDPDDPSSRFASEHLIPSIHKTKIKI
jgi:multidrug efflux pump subunit AcrB